MASQDNTYEVTEQVTLPQVFDNVLLLLKPGQLLAERFRIVQSLGAGGMGQVYEAEDCRLGEHVALKIPSFNASADRKEETRFLREVMLARRVTHRNVCRVFDMGVAFPGSPNERCFFTMELLKGTTLEKHRKRMRAFSPTGLLLVLQQLMEGLEAAHSVGVVHRDLKPANILLVPDSQGGTRIVITDFGLAASALGDLKKITLGCVGTPTYMAPEQVRDKQAVTPAADIYALGVILFELITGTVPFVGENWFATAWMRVEREPPSPRYLVPELDAAWEALILRCLARLPTDRFASVAELRAAIPGSPPTVGRTTCSRFDPDQRISA